MLEYVKRLLLMQTKLAAQFDAGQTPEIRETALHAEAVQTEDALMDETAAKTQKMEASERAKSDQTQEQTVEDKLRELTRQTMRMESLQQQKTAQKEQEQTRRLEAAPRCRSARWSSLKNGRRNVRQAVLRGATGRQ